MAETSGKSAHILNSSATLFGLCFVVFTSLKALNLDKNTLIDESTAVTMVLFMTSCLLSFLSIRGHKQSALYEKIADYVFVTGLFTLIGLTLSITFNVVR